MFPGALPDYRRARACETVITGESTRKHSDCWGVAISADGSTGRLGRPTAGPPGRGGPPGGVEDPSPAARGGHKRGFPKNPPPFLNPPDMMAAASPAAHQYLCRVEPLHQQTSNAQQSASNDLAKSSGGRFLRAKCQKTFCRPPGQLSSVSPAVELFRPSHKIRPNVRFTPDATKLLRSSEMAR